MAPAGAVALSIAAWPIGIWYGIGIVVLVYLYLKHPERLPEMKRVFADDALPPRTSP